MYTQWIKRGFLTLLVVFVAIQLVPVNRTNLPIDPAKKLLPPPEVEAILRVSCYDCHTNETRWPWYSYVAPVSWWIADHVHSGQRHLNLSTWADLQPRAGRNGQTMSVVQYKRKLLGNMETSIQEGQMPISSYLIIHHDARMSPQQYQEVAAWLDSEMGKQK